MTARWTPRFRSAGMSAMRRGSDRDLRPGAVRPAIRTTGITLHLGATGLPSAVITVNVSSIPQSSRFGTRSARSEGSRLSGHCPPVTVQNAAINQVRLHKRSFVVRAILMVGLAAGFLLPIFGANAQAIDKSKFFASCKSRLPTVVSGDRAKAVEDVIDYWENKGYEDRRALAYVLGTAFRETAGTLRPVREGLCKTDKCSVAAVTKHLADQGIAGNYATPDAAGRSYFGRGYVQLTHAKNYKKLGEALGWGNALLENPNLALDHTKSIEILVEGMHRGLFTGKKLGDYFSSTKEDWIEARKIVNPGSKRAEITARHGQDFFACLREA